MITIETAQVPDAEFTLDRQVKTVNTIAVPLDFLKVKLNPWKYRKKIWFATGITTQTITLAIVSDLIFNYKGVEVLRLPYNTGNPGGITKNVSIGNTNDFGTTSSFTLFDEPFFADYKGVFVGTCPWKLLITCDEIIHRITSFNGDAAAEYFGFLMVQQEFPY